jgi:hypothetical protein
VCVCVCVCVSEWVSEWVSEGVSESVCVWVCACIVCECEWVCEWMWACKCVRVWQCECIRGYMWERKREIESLEGFEAAKFLLMLSSPVGSRAHVVYTEANFTSWRKQVLASVIEQKPRMYVCMYACMYVCIHHRTEATTFSQRFKQICDYFKTCYTDTSHFSSRDQHVPYFSLTRPVSPYLRSLPRFAESHIYFALGFGKALLETDYFIARREK